MSLEFTDKLVDWFWQFGIQREGEYAISTSEFTKDLYRIKKELEVVRESSGKSRPAFAIWGPSQTGKSTLLSSYLDEKAVFTRKEGEDGCNSGLHWQGGDPFFFMKPKGAGEEMPVWVNVLNPFNSGRDASACLSRFVDGSLSPEPGKYYVHSPKYPVQIELVSKKDLLHTLARGYESECLGPVEGDATYWEQSKFEAVLDEIKVQAQEAKIQPNRKAYELVHDFCEILDDLIFADLMRFKSLSSIKSLLLRDKVLISNEDLVEALAAKVLWDGFDAITNVYKKISASLNAYSQKWQGKTIHCSLGVAALFLDMDAMYYCFIGADKYPEGTKQRRIVDRVNSLSYKEDEKHVYIGFDEGKRLIHSPEDFAILQGVVWEMVIPINSANVNDSPFKHFLQKADVLDFPGVGNEAQTKASRINCTRISNQPSSEEDRNRVVESGNQLGITFTPDLFFYRILKRGKTASIVCTFAKRSLIDGFCIFQYLDKHSVPTADQLITGINTWWKSMVPEYYTNQSGASPLPLNLVLSWWATMISEAPSDTATLFSSAKRFYEKFGNIGKPDVVTTFAVNYYSLFRGQIKAGIEWAPGSKLYTVIKNEPEFKKQFRLPVSQESFEQMVVDKVTGGTNFLFSQLANQVDQSQRDSRFNRKAILERKQKEAVALLLDLLGNGNIFPQPREINMREIFLEKLLSDLTSAIQGKNERQMREINYVLREFLDINPNNLEIIPADDFEITEAFIKSQFDKWVNTQTDRFKEWKAGGEKSGPNWKTLQLTGGEIQFREYLNAMAVSTKYRMEGVVRGRSASWKKQLQ